MQQTKVRTQTPTETGDPSQKQNPLVKCECTPISPKVASRMLVYCHHTILERSSMSFDFDLNATWGVITGICVCERDVEVEI